MAGFVYKPVGTATHYHADYVVPYWAPTLTKNAVIGAHIFYRWAGGWGRLPAFTQGYSHREPSVEALRSAALIAEQRDIATRGQLGAGAKAIAEIPGAEVLKLAPSMRGDKRVAVRFNLAAREATDKIEAKPYVEQVKASDNLRWSLERRNGRGRRKAARQGRRRASGRRDGQRRPAHPSKKAPSGASNFTGMARVTGLEPATSGVTGRRSNQLSYTRVFGVAAN